MDLRYDQSQKERHYFVLFFWILTHIVASVFDYFVYMLQVLLQNCWDVLIQLWVKYGQTQPLGYIFLITF